MPLDLTTKADFDGHGAGPRRYAGKGLWYPGRYYDPTELNEPQLTRSVERTYWLVLDAAEGVGGWGRSNCSSSAGFSQGVHVPRRATRCAILHRLRRLWMPTAA